MKSESSLEMRIHFAGSYTYMQRKSVGIYIHMYKLQLATWTLDSDISCSKLLVNSCCKSQAATGEDSAKKYLEEGKQLFCAAAVTMIITIFCCGLIGALVAFAFIFQCQQISAVETAPLYFVWQLCSQSFEHLLHEIKWIPYSLTKLLVISDVEHGNLKDMRFQNQSEIY